MEGNPIPPIEIDNQEIDWFEEFKRNYVNVRAIKPLLLSIDEKLGKIGSSESESESSEEGSPPESEPNESEESSDSAPYLENFEPKMDIDAWEHKNKYFLSNDLKAYFKVSLQTV